MPIVNIEIFEGRSLDEKRALVQKVTEAVTETIKVPAEAVHVVIREMKRENYAEGGKLFSDR